jgi:hypothetical protein
MRLVKGYARRYQQYRDLGVHLLRFGKKFYSSPGRSFLVRASGYGTVVARLAQPASSPP